MAITRIRRVLISLPLIGVALFLILAPAFPTSFGSGGLNSKKALTETLFSECKNLIELSLASDINSLEWIKTRSLKTLNAPGVTSLKGVPRSIRDLNIQGATTIQSLRSVPRKLKALDIQNSGIRDLKPLPARLQILKLSDLELRRVDVLPPNLQELYLENVQIQDFSYLPRSLRELHLSAALRFEKLEDLPPSLRVLTLSNTEGESLQGIPHSVQELKLIKNKNLRFEVGDLPERLTELTIDQPLGPEDLGKLRYLTWLSDLRKKPATVLPSSLSSLTLEATSFLKLPELPSGLQALGLINAKFDPLANLPSSLQKLSLISYQGPDQRPELSRLPQNLRRFYLRYPTRNLRRLPELSPILEELHIVDTKITDLGGAPVEAMKTLVFCKTATKKIDGIRNRFPNLEQLDLCESPALSEMGPIPAKLKRLNISSTNINRLPDLRSAPALQELNISHTPIRLDSLKVLPRGLKILVLSKDQVTSWEGFPPALEVLRVEG